jgi:tetratricopeptide (TPR) repeat protein
MTVWLDRIQPEHDNIRAALAWSLEHDPELTLRQASSLRLFWEVRGNFREGLHWIEEALAYADNMPPELRFRGLAGSGAIATRLGDLDLAQRRKEAALALAREMDDELGIARELSDLGTVAAMREEYDVATEMFEESAALFRKLDIPSRLGTVLSNLGHIASQQGDYELAIEVTEEALALESSHKQNAAISSYNLGSYNLQGGRLEAARDWLERTVALTLELGFKEVMAYALAAFARLCLIEGDAARGAYLAGIADRQLADAGLQLQPSEQALFDEAKAALEQQLGDEFTAIHHDAMAAPLEESLRQGAVLAQAPASP